MSQSSQKSSDASQAKTVFVLGAGASFEVGLPVGENLKDEIVRLLSISFSNGYRQQSGDHAIVEAFRQAVRDEPNRDINPLIRAGHRICKAMPQALSIDNFLDVHNDNVHVEIAGKLAITQAILKSERNSLLYFQREDSCFNFQQVKNTWFNRFFQAVSENCKPSELSERLSRTSIISFNYDRCLIHFLYHSLKNYYGSGLLNVEETVKSLEVLYPYGSVGDLPLTSPPGIEFGADLSGPALFDVSKKIKTFTERTDEESLVLKTIRRRLREANRIVFLGFAFHPLNMDLMAPKGEIENSECLLLGTTYGISNNDRMSISEDMQIRFGTQKFNFPVLTCADLYSEFWRTLSMAR